MGEVHGRGLLVEKEDVSVEAGPVGREGLEVVHHSLATGEVGSLNIAHLCNARGNLS